MPLKQLVQGISPKPLFLLDSAGALLSAIIVGLVLTSLESAVGLPARVLQSLAFIACIFCAYSFLCFLSKTEKWRRYMKIIATANLLYCCLTIGLVVYFYQQLTALGAIYFMLEVTIITTLAVIELKTASSLLNFKPYAEK